MKKKENAIYKITVVSYDKEGDVYSYAETSPKRADAYNWYCSCCDLITDLELRGESGFIRFSKDLPDVSLTIMIKRYGDLR